MPLIQRYPVSLQDPHFQPRLRDNLLIKEIGYI